MTPVGFEPPPPVPTDRLIRATAGAFVVALLIVVSIVLPVEYGVDPLHTGAALGLLRTNAPPPPVVVPTSLAEAMTPKSSGPSTQYPVPFQTDRATFELGPYDYLEYKYHLAAGAALVYSWDASAQLIHDFHGAPDAPAAQSEPSLDKNQNPIVRESDRAVHRHARIVPGESGRHAVTITRRRPAATAPRSVPI